MIQLEELKLKLSENEPLIEDLKEAIGVSRLEEEIKELEKVSSVPDFWDDIENSQRILQKISFLKSRIRNYKKLKNLYEDTETLIDLAIEEKDLSLLDEARKNVELVQKELESQRLEILLNGEFDSKNAILTLHAGAGGTEAQDWVDMLVLSVG